MSTTVDYKAMTKKTERPRNAIATREAILQSAFEAFARAGYDGVGVREIAGNAGVTAMLVNRYFGSKEELFAEVLAKAMNSPSVISLSTVQEKQPAADLASVLVQATTGAPLGGFRVIINSASNKRAAEIIREQIEKYHHSLVASTVAGDNASERAALLLSLVAGFQFMRQIIGLGALAQGDPETLVGLLRPLFRELMDA